jgi:hypothetical protein
MINNSAGMRKAWMFDKDRLKVRISRLVKWVREIQQVERQEEVEEDTENVDVEGGEEELDSRIREGEDMTGRCRKLVCSFKVCMTLVQLEHDASSCIEVELPAMGA